MQLFHSVRVGSRTGPSGPTWLGAVMMGLVLFWFGRDAFTTANAMEGRAGYSLPTGRRAKRSITYAVAERYHASLGRWECAAAFFVPGIFVVECGVWDFRRWFRGLAESP